MCGGPHDRPRAANGAGQTPVRPTVRGRLHGGPCAAHRLNRQTLPHEDQNQQGSKREEPLAITPATSEHPAPTSHGLALRGPRAVHPVPAVGWCAQLWVGSRRPTTTAPHGWDQHTPTTQRTPPRRQAPSQTATRTRVKPREATGDHAADHRTSRAESTRPRRTRTPCRPPYARHPPMRAVMGGIAAPSHDGAARVGSKHPNHSKLRLRKPRLLPAATQFTAEESTGAGVRIQCALSATKPPVIPRIRFSGSLAYADRQSGPERRRDPDNHLSADCHYFPLLAVTLGRDAEVTRDGVPVLVHGVE
ncbi:hypothetical protein BJ981_004714 [Sphaerisporangium krabiense]|uniref:Uncharacterized protein n=1 Tax=Sphaerisporangium krabiense TaxID=763782 RepID=A0A7W8Z818_9ACTN|nr:hypothetical protein [Sphaerisporangium krabiense]